MSKDPAIERRVLFVAYTYPPCANVGVFRTLRFTRYLAEMNWQSTVITSLPDSQTRIDNDLLARIPDGTRISRVRLVRTEDQIKAGIKRIVTRNSEPKKPQRQSTVNESTPAEHAVIESHWQSFRRKASELMFAMPDNRIAWKRPAVRAGVEAARRDCADAVVGTGPPFSTLLVAKEIAEQVGLPLVLDFRDPWSRVPWGPRNHSQIANRLAASMERRCVMAARKVVLNTNRMCEEFRNHYCDLPAERFVAIANGYDPDLVIPDLQSVCDHAPLRSNARPLKLLHPGSFYRNRDPRPVLHAIAELKNRGINVELTQLGPCEAAFDLVGLAKSLQIDDRVKVESAVPHREMLERMKQADAFLLLQPGTSVQVPGKLFEMMMFRKPIAAIATEGEVTEIIRQFKMGTVASPTHIPAIADAIGGLANFPYEEPAWDHALKTFDGRELTRCFAEVLDAVTEA